jgi:predicted CoA-binding protein
MAMVVRGCNLGDPRLKGTVMPTLREAAEEFLAQPRIAVAGVSRDTKQPANLIYRRLRDTGHDVFAVNPHADEVEGVRSYPSVTAIPDAVDGVVVVTPAKVSESIVADCVEAGVPRVWLHRGLGPGSSSEAAVALGRANGLSVISGGCPNMFGATADPGHRCILAMLRVTGKLPRSVGATPPAALPRA